MAELTTGRYCGRSKDYCEAKTCQKSFGICDSASPSSTIHTTLSSVTITSSAQPTCSVLSITLPALPASTVTVPGEEVTVTVTAKETSEYLHSYHTHTGTDMVSQLRCLEKSAQSSLP